MFYLYNTDIILPKKKLKLCDWAINKQLTNKYSISVVSHLLFPIHVICPPKGYREGVRGCMHMLVHSLALKAWLPLGPNQRILQPRLPRWGKVTVGHDPNCIRIILPKFTVLYMGESFQSTD